jgi:hypothetical protein
MTITIPIHTISEANNRDHWRVRKVRKDAQQLAVAAALSGKQRPAPPFAVTLTRIGKRKLDGDNLQSAFKGIRDQIAKWLKVDDGDEAKVSWWYGQEVGKGYAIRVEIGSVKCRTIT